MLAFEKSSLLDLTCHYDTPEVDRLRDFERSWNYFLYIQQIGVLH